MTDTLNIGIAGAGWFASVHAAALAELPSLRIAAVSAGTPAATEAFAARHGGRPAPSWQALVDDPGIDAVLVAMPHHLHAPVAIAAARAGKHVLLEKPMAPTLAECRAIIAAAEAARIHLLVGQVMRFSRTGLAARDLLASGALGRPITGRSHFNKLWMEPNRRPWHLARATGGGMLLTAGIHALDRLLWLMDANAEAVSAISTRAFHDHDTADLDLLLLRLSNNRTATVASIGTTDSTMTNTTELICENGTLLLDVERGLRLAQGNRWTDIPDSRDPQILRDGLVREWAALHAAITRNTALPVTPAQAAHLVAIIETATAASEARRELPVPPV